MLSEICGYLRNYFDRDQPKFYGGFRVQDGEICSFNDGDMGLQEGQYYRIMGSVFNDGVWEYGNTDNFKVMKDETFSGAVWLMAIPPDLIALSNEIDNWITKYGGVDAPAMSPYSSESFGGYSYNKSGGYASNSSDDGEGTWQGVFKNRLKRWKKL